MYVGRNDKITNSDVFQYFTVNQDSRHVNNNINFLRDTVITCTL